MHVHTSSCTDLPYASAVTYIKNDPLTWRWQWLDHLTTAQPISCHVTREIRAFNLLEFSGDWRGRTDRSISFVPNQVRWFQQNLKVKNDVYWMDHCFAIIRPKCQRAAVEIWNQWWCLRIGECPAQSKTTNGGTIKLWRNSYLSKRRVPMNNEAHDLSKKIQRKLVIQTWKMVRTTQWT